MVTAAKYQIYAESIKPRYQARYQPLSEQDITVIPEPIKQLKQSDPQFENSN